MGTSMNWVHPTGKDKGWAWSDFNLLQKQKKREETHSMTGLVYSLLMPFIIIAYAVYVFQAHQRAAYAKTTDTMLVPILEQPVVLSVTCRAPRGCIISSRYIRTGIGKKCASANGIGPDDKTDSCKFVPYGTVTRVYVCYDPIPRDGLNIYWNNTKLTDKELQIRKAKQKSTYKDSFFEDYRQGMIQGDFGSSITTKWFQVAEDGSLPQQRSQELPLSEGTYGISYSQMEFRGESLEGFFPYLISNKGYFENWASVTDGADNADYLDKKLCQTALKQYPGLPYTSVDSKGKLGPKSGLRYQKVRIAPKFVKVNILDKSLLDVLGVIGGGYNVVFLIGAILVAIHVQCRDVLFSSSTSSVEVKLDETEGTCTSDASIGIPQQASERGTGK